MLFVINLWQVLAELSLVFPLDNQVVNLSGEMFASTVRDKSKTFTNQMTFFKLLFTYFFIYLLFTYLFIYLFMTGACNLEW